MTNGFTGAEIEQTFVDALYNAFAEKREPDDDDIRQAIAETVPLSRLMSEQKTDGPRATGAPAIFLSYQPSRSTQTAPTCLNTDMCLLGCRVGCLLGCRVGCLGASGPEG